MNRLEMITVFTSLKHHVKNKDLEAISDVVETVLREACVKKETTESEKDKLKGDNN